MYGPLMTLNIGKYIATEELTLLPDHARTQLGNRMTKSDWQHESHPVFLLGNFEGSIFGTVLRLAI